MSSVIRPPATHVLGNLYAPIMSHLHQVDNILRDRLRSDIPFIEELTNRVQLYQGKRIRPAALLLTAEALGSVRHEHYVLSAVIEIIHGATLVHDDLLDEAKTRRHVTTVHAEWGTEASVLLGDYLFSQAYHLAATLDTPIGCRIVGEATNRTCEGELHQVSRRGCFDLTESEYIDIVAGKTAELLSCACRLGARFAGAREDVADAMARFGRHVGIAFQIADDVLDLVGDESRTGKSIGTDWEKRKMTLPFIRLRETADPDVLARFKEYFDNPAQPCEALLPLLKTSDAVAYAEGKAREYADSAARELSVLPPGPARDSLTQLARFSASRGY